MVKTFAEYVLEHAELNEAVSKHHSAAVRHGYRVGTHVGTHGYFTKGGGFTHVYYHPKANEEIHVHTGPKGEVDKWVHVGEKGDIHRVGVHHAELWSHLRAYHPEVAEKAAKDRQTKEKSEMDKTLASKQGKILDKMARSSKLPSISLNVPASAGKKKPAKKKAKK